jgi:hypothetical protein
MACSESNVSPRTGLPRWRPARMFISLCLLGVLGASGFAACAPSTSGRRTDANSPSSTVTPSEDPNHTIWKLFRAIDFSRNDGGWVDTGYGSSRDSSISRPEQARFGTGPKGKWLTVVAQRATDDSPIYSVDLLGRAYAIPNYFAIDLVYELPTIGAGMWPAPLWMRPLSTEHDPDPQGEIDVVEWFGARRNKIDEAAGSLHETPYGPTHRQLSLPLPLLGGEWRSLEHRVRVEKVPGSMTWWVDGARAGTLTRADFDATAGVGSWDAMFENQRRWWYPRITYQVGPGQELDLAGRVPRGWRRSTMVIKNLAIFARSF